MVKVGQSRWPRAQPPGQVIVGPFEPSTQVPLQAVVSAVRQAHDAGSQPVGAMLHSTMGAPPVSSGVCLQKSFVPKSHTECPQWNAVAGMVQAPVESKSDPFKPAHGSPFKPETVPSQKQTLGPSLQNIGRGAHVPAIPAPQRPSRKLQYSLERQSADVVHAPPDGAQRIVVLHAVTVLQVFCGHDVTKSSPGPHAGAAAQGASWVQRIVFPQSSTSWHVAPFGHVATPISPKAHDGSAMQFCMHAGCVERKSVTPARPRTREPKVLRKSTTSTLHASCPRHARGARPTSPDQSATTGREPARFEPTSDRSGELRPARRAHSMTDVS